MVYSRYHQDPVTHTGLKIGHSHPGYSLGDTNYDGSVNSYDIDGSVCPASPQCDCEALYPNCNCLLTNCHGEVTVYDIDTFMLLVSGE